jgi:RHS repeat-associated protein
MKFPLGSLPPGRGEVRAGFTYYFNSKLFDSGRQDNLPTGGGGTYSAHLLSASSQGGGKYGYQYKLQVFTRPDSIDYPPCTVQTRFIYRVVITYPDGSDHEFRPWGYFSQYGDGYYDIAPSGWQNSCSAGSPIPPIHVTNSMIYYSIDGTYTRLEIDTSNSNLEDAQDYDSLPWKMFLPDGSKITANEVVNGNYTYQRFYDRNNNWVEIQNVLINNHQAVMIFDEFLRQVVLEYDGGGLGIDTITSPAPNNQTVVWKVVRKSLSPDDGYLTYGSDGNTYGFTFPGTGGAGQIIAPTQPNPLTYSFTYNSENGGNGAGELQEMLLPSSAKVTYTFKYGNACSVCTPYYEDVLMSQVSQKQKSYVEEYDCTSCPTTYETWTYTKTSAYTETKAPDEGRTKEYAFCNETPCPIDNYGWSGGLVYKIERPDGSVIERLWQANSPQNSYEVSYANPYVKTEFTSIKDGSTLSKTAIKDYSYDKNGNVTRVVEYDWVDYDDVPRDPVTLRPTGIPAEAESKLKRVTVNEYYVVTPDASDTTDPNQYVYHRTTAPKLRTALKSKEIRSALTSGIKSRVEYCYEGASCYIGSTTTGNISEEKTWDSRKGLTHTQPDWGSSPLDATNSISVTHQYGTWLSGATGKRTSTTDANGVTTNYSYDDIGNGWSNIYVTKVETAANYPALKRTTMSQYDFGTGLVTETRDVDNNVTTLTTYDHLGRPTLVEEKLVGGASLRKAVTEYSDAARRVITREDQDSVGDGKLITIDHYDQWGRLRLTRELESGNPAEATDETKGVKIQTRYFAGSSTVQNSYDLVSAPYRANYSYEAGNEPGMAWKRTKHDQSGRFIEVETFAGATPPFPWNNNTVSTGKVVTSYNANSTAVMDQAKKVRRSLVDGLGRLKRVDEPNRDFEAGELNNPNPNLLLGSVDEPVQRTDYEYNALDNLIQTSQTGVLVGSSSSVTQTRTFAYSSLGRLLSANNPESGTIYYEYDNNGNLKKKIDARGDSFSISYNYDALNRNTTINYANTITVNPDITRVYGDNNSSPAYGKGKLWKSYAGGDETNGQTVEKKTVNSYDALGRPLSVSQQFKTNGGSWSSNFTTSQTYDLADHVLTKTYPAGASHNANYSYDAAGDLVSFNGKLGDGVTQRTYSTGLLYNPQGQMTREQFGTATPLYHRRHYNARGQLFDVRLGTVAGSHPDYDGPDPTKWLGTSWNRGAIRFYYSSNYNDHTGPITTPQNNNGNLYAQDIFVPATLDGSGNVATWTMGVDYYGYDWLNRLTKVDELPAASWVGGGSIGWLPQAYAQHYKYDRFGNRLLDTVATWGIGINRKAFRMEGTIMQEPTVTNRLKVPVGQPGVMKYDAAGNLTRDTWTGGSAARFNYDAENRIKTATNDSSTTIYGSYTYDADGRRVRRVVWEDGVQKEYWQVYGVGGELVAEYQLVSGTATLKKEYGYRNGQLLVIADALNNNCQWLVSDALGTPRMLVDQTGSLAGMKRRDYLPFGEELPAGMGHRQVSDGYGFGAGPRQQFTGKERDSETGLDYFEARYYSSVLGRFTSPDEFAGGPTEMFAEVAAHNPTFYAEPAEPQSLNKYAYCLNNPFKFVDPDGHQGLLTDLVAQDLIIGAAKEVANTGISIDNFVRGKNTQLFEPDNQIQAAAMHATEVGLFFATPFKAGPANIMFAEAKVTSVRAAKLRVAEGVAEMKENMKPFEKSVTTYARAEVKTKAGKVETWVSAAGETGYVPPRIRGNAKAIKSPAKPQHQDLPHINDAERQIMRKSRREKAEILGLGATRKMCSHCDTAASKMGIKDRIVE